MGGIPVQVLRGGASKGAYFLASDLPADPAERDRLLRALTGPPGRRRIDGIGESKVAVVSRSADAGADVDYLFLEVGATRPRARPCGDILAGVGPFAIERGLVPARAPITGVRVRVLGTGEVATVHVPTVDGRPSYAGDTRLSGVPGGAARLRISYPGPARLPTGRVIDDLDGVPATLIDNGTPMALIEAEALGVTGHESATRLEYDARLRHRVAGLRRPAVALMGAPPKMCLLARPADGGSLSTRTFLPDRVHAAIGVRAAVGVGAAVAFPGSVAAGLVAPVADRSVPRDVLRLEHPSGFLDLVLGDSPSDTSVVSTARLLLDGRVFAP
ncbi:PrpF domain-containing protein [Actinoplanes flavus]|uniref:4-oxalomesaconate tautomerase n=1 Tax=Actinoplanes flavus TaxID=2820290 RepID=A0ABS3UJU2_9ACTN|nr:PrpF domain-containing protein [Actinoplanes flavus]MBO3739039.1 4-oxalomesaconate tautomerase [Actinoplanes flavus]